MKKINVLFVGDIFGRPGIEAFKKYLPKIKEKFEIDFIVVQAENISGRKGLNSQDYQELKDSGVDAFTLGNHVWSNVDIYRIIENKDLLRPHNVDLMYPGQGSEVFEKNGIKIRVTSLLGITFNKLLLPWQEEYANNFFDAMDEIIENDESDFHIVDFHAETTSEKNVLALYLDGQVSAVLGTHTHVQTNDAKILPKGTAFISDAGMTGPADSAIGANFQEVYEKMRFDRMVKFEVSKNEPQFNGVFLELSEEGNKITPINIYKDQWK